MIDRKILEERISSTGSQVRISDSFLILVDKYMDKFGDLSQSIIMGLVEREGQLEKEKLINFSYVLKQIIKIELKKDLDEL